MKIATPPARTDIDRTPVAADVFTYCTREKIDTWHVVRNHDAQGIVDRVVCKACGSEHKYRRAAKPSTTPARAGFVRREGQSLGKAAAPKPTSSAQLEEQWLSGLKKWGDKAVRPYAPSLPLANGEVVEHASFGKGVVQSRRENKVEVLFRVGLKTLPSPKL